MTRKAKVQINLDKDLAVARRRGHPFLLLLIAGGAYLVLRQPKRQQQLQQKLTEYQEAARQGTLAEVAQRDASQVRAQVQQWRDKAGQAVNMVKKGQEVAQVAKGGIEPAAKLAEDAQVILSSQDPQEVGQAVQDAKARLSALADTGREVTSVLENQPDASSSTTEQNAATQPK
ncbi:hypothetical protein [Deinococcus peraridilitoris]|uniref:Uncharacterized protein n=1 Tax=Deinococcus peraridilitoris (strain DSM 19664 / LMG 22246 / CIP 109416 / KR-200) TaxID=937777 RepID=L0A8K5_DEIPD|nr:hypothetical protein [Deinococcus peraridilitoris]AFZ69410.1 hypothetical protein Deipe_4018 [Deinococcus peraridilitoris DSM 19664]